jgi:hypothetical protein
MGIAGASALSLGVPAASLKASPPEKTDSNLPPSALVELNNLPFLSGREYFVLRSGRATVIYQVDRVDLGPVFTWMLFDARNALQSTTKAGAFNFDPQHGFASSALRVELGGFTFKPFGEQTESRLVHVDGVPAIEAMWWAGGVKVTERITALAGSEAFLETIQLDGSCLAGDDAVSLKLFLPRGQIRGSGPMLVQNSAQYGCGIAVLGDTQARANEEEGFLTLGPIEVSPRSSSRLKFCGSSRSPRAVSMLCSIKPVLSSVGSEMNVETLRPPGIKLRRSQRATRLSGIFTTRLALDSQA